MLDLPGADVLTGHETHLYIGGEWVPATDGRTVEVINPTTEEPIGSVVLAGPADIDRAVGRRAPHSTPGRGPHRRPSSAPRS